MGQFSDELLKQWIAPEIDQCPVVNLPDFSESFESAKYWFQQYFLNNVFTGSYSIEFRPYATNIIYRIQMTFDGYQQARERTRVYAEQWSSGSPGIYRYMSAVSAWEAVFLNLQTIYDLLRKSLGVQISGREDNARKIANRIKHIAEDIQEGRTVEPSIPMWLTQNGFRTHNAEMTFEEMSGQIEVLLKIADCLCVPSKARERFKELDRELEGDPNYSLVP